MTNISISSALQPVFRMSFSEAALILFLGVFFLFVALFRLLRPVDRRPPPTGKKWRLPPGPRGYPLIGNLLLYGQGEAAGHQIARYGEMTTTHLGSKLWVVLNSNRLVSELYGRKGSVTNGRPRYPMVNELISQGRRSVLLPADGWTERRRVMHQLLSGSALNKYQEYQNTESITLLASYSERPKDWFLHNRTYSNSVIHRITFGERPGAGADVDKVAEAQFYFLMNAPPYNFWDCFPDLAKLPLALQWWRGKYDQMGKATHEAYSAYWKPLKENIELGKAPQSFARDLVFNEGKFSGGEDDKMFLAMQLVEAGSDTTRLTTNIFILAAVTNPDKFLKARQQLDEVCGSHAERLPEFSDEKNLPYINAFAKEMLRWRRIFDWTPEHMLTEDLEFEGYFFPKGTNFVINHAAIANDPASYEDPKEFQPERWLDGREAEIWEGSWQFGHGRRLCVGYRLAQKSIFINLARLIYCFDFKAREPFDDRNINHFTSNEPFPIEVTLRGEKFGSLIQRAAQQQPGEE
ncbi:O-methylsterigmatocystin oxido [Cyphellophora attinorum]|uniref:O-methylsterigmatocystin oxido n=1 Tax=Cyphellophora attinorum TaxID=1664694 RepID=A0A0N1HHU8_9EURO|nr:O-methylsterigmatocystin oxido [Phialophora attinorum]KPI45704.1 O-methylsterigmatocystin oxido [Phialophora attinorum]